MRIPSGVTDQYAFFKAVDTTDLTTPETGLASPTNKFRVKRSRNGGAWTTYTTPTVNATDTGGDGYYELLVDEDTTIDAGDFSQLMLIHIEDTGARMEPVALQIELFRPPGGDTGRLNVNVAEFADTGINDRLSRIGFDADTGLRAQLSDVDTGLHDTIADLDTGLRDYIDNTDTGLRAVLSAGVVSTISDTGTLDAIAWTLLNKGVVDGRKVVEAFRLWTSVLGGTVSGAGTGTEIFTKTNAATARVTATVDSSGNRSAITYALDT